MIKNLHHTKNYLIGSIGIKALGFISVPFFTNFLTVEEFGMMSLYVSILSFLSTLLSLGVLGSFKRYYFEENNNFGAFLYSNLIMLLILDSILMLVYFYYIMELSAFLNIPQVVLGYAIFISFLTLIIKVQLDFLQIREHSKKNVVLEFIKTLVSLIASIGFVLILTDNKFMGKVYGDLLVCLLFASYSLYYLSKTLQIKFKFEYLKYSLQFGLPVLPSMFSSFGLAFADRLMINNYTTTEDVGLYSFAFTVAMLTQVVILAISKSWQPLFYKAMSEENVDILNKTFLQNTKLVLSASLFIILFSYEFIMLLANENYLTANHVIVYLVLGFNFFFLYTIYGHYVSYSKKTYLDAVMTSIAVSINVGLNYIFIPKYGYEASAITTIISYFVLFLLFYFNAKYVLKADMIGLSNSLKLHVLYVLFVSTFVIFGFYVDMNYLQNLLVKGLIYFIFIYLLFQNFIIHYIKERFLIAK
jgi:O-antigen/teichoic acid export membrane protein